MPWRLNVEKVMSIIDKQCMVGRDIMDQGAGTGRKHGQMQTTLDLYTAAWGNGWKRK